MPTVMFKLRVLDWHGFLKIWTTHLEQYIFLRLSYLGFRKMYNKWQKHINQMSMHLDVFTTK